MPRETLARIAREQRKDGVTIQFRVLPAPVSSSRHLPEDDEEKNVRREKMMVVSVVKVTTKKKEEGEGDEEEEEEEEIARFESRENELVPGDLCEVEERMSGGVDASASVVAKLARKFHPTRDETAKNQAGAKCKTRTDMLVQKKNEKFNTKLLGNYERRPEEDATAVVTTTTKVVSEALMAAKAGSAQTHHNNDRNANTNEALALLNNKTTAVNGGRIGAEELEKMAKRRISLVRATILLAESKNSESLVVATTSKAVEKEQVSQKPLTSAAINSEIVCRECIFSLLHERKLSKDALREAIVRGFESATKLNRKKQLREQILETPLRDTFERALKEVANFRAPGRYELKRERVEEGRRANASASLWIVQEEDVNANAPIMVNVKRARAEEVDNDEDERGGSKKKNDVLTPPLFLESRNREKEEAARKKRSNQGGPQAVSPVYQPEELVQRALKDKSSSSSDDDDDDDVFEPDDGSSGSLDSDTDTSDSDSEDSSEIDSSDSESDEVLGGVQERASSKKRKPSSSECLTDDSDTEWQSFESKDGKAVLKLFRRIGRNKIRPITEAHLAAWNVAFNEYWSIHRRLHEHGAKISLCEDLVAIYENSFTKKQKKRNQSKYEKSKSDLLRLRSPESEAYRHRMRAVLEEIDAAFGGKTREKLQSFVRKRNAAAAEKKKAKKKKKKRKSRL